jgi:hypothetical protein
MPNYQAKILVSLCIFLSLAVTQVQAKSSRVLGMHLLHPQEIDDVRRIYTDEEWRFVTIPLTLNDLDKKQEWQKFFDQAYAAKLTPIIRLTTRHDPKADAWQIPSRKDIVELSKFLSSLNWHQDDKFVIVFNEVNHTKEWGGKLDPLLYVEVLKFTSQWLRSEDRGYKILPSAMDLAANNSADTREAFSYLSSMWQIEPELGDYFDYWNSHSYPNPEFSASPSKKGQNSISGFVHELAWLKKKTGRDFEVFITETGWASSYLVNYRLSEYYLYALRYIWSDERIKAVTPFIIKGSPGPFASFSFFDAANNPTIQTFALQKAIKTFDALTF